MKPKLILTVILILIVTGCSSPMYPSGFFAELTNGEHWDCDKVRHWEGMDDKKFEEKMDAMNYCSHDPSYQYTGCGSDGKASNQYKDWKTGQCMSK